MALALGLGREAAPVTFGFDAITAALEGVFWDQKGTRATGRAVEGG